MTVLLRDEADSEMKCMFDYFKLKDDNVKGNEKLNGLQFDPVV